MAIVHSREGRVRYRPVHGGWSGALLPLRLSDRGGIGRPFASSPPALRPAATCSLALRAVGQSPNPATGRGPSGWISPQGPVRQPFRSAKAKGPKSPRRALAERPNSRTARTALAGRPPTLAFKRRGGAKLRPGSQRFREEDKRPGSAARRDRDERWKETMPRGRTARENGEARPRPTHPPSSRRKPGSMAQLGATITTRWIPAFAGMTKEKKSRKKAGEAAPSPAHPLSSPRRRGPSIHRRCKHIRGGAYWIPAGVYPRTRSEAGMTKRKNTPAATLLPPSDHAPDRRDEHRGQRNLEHVAEHEGHHAARERPGRADAGRAASENARTTPAI